MHACSQRKTMNAAVLNCYTYFIESNSKGHKDINVHRELKRFLMSFRHSS